MGLLPPSSAADTFASTLSQEVAAVTQFAALLESEQADLSAGRVDALEDIVAAKALLVQQLNQFAEQRNRLIQSQGYTADREGIDAWLAAHGTPALRHTWEQLQHQAQRAKQLNGQNGQLIALRMQSTSGALQVLLQRNQAPAADVYGPDGQRLGGGGTGSRLIDSV